MWTSASFEKDDVGLHHFHHLHALDGKRSVHSKQHASGCLPQHIAKDKHEPLIGTKHFLDFPGIEKRDQHSAYCCWLEEIQKLLGMEVVPMERRK